MEKLGKQVKRLQHIVEVQKAYISKLQNQISQLTMTSEALKHQLETNTATKWKMAKDLSESMNKMHIAIHQQQQFQDELHEMRDVVSNITESLKSKTIEMEMLERRYADAHRQGQEDVFNEWKEIMSPNWHWNL